MRSELLKELDFDAVRGRHLLVGLSGGADSVALICLLAERRESHDLRLTAAHYNHQIRGEEALADAHFCENLCRKLDIPLIMGQGDVPAEAARQHMGLESMAREMRYRFLYKTMEKCSAEMLALAHHLNDQAETVLMHLFRGCGPEGIGGMDMQNGRLYRPLLNISKADLCAYLTGKGIIWREDSTNQLADTPRNALRLNVMPGIEQSYPSAAEAIGRYARAARLESDYIARKTDEFAQEKMRKLPGGVQIRLDGGYEEALLRRLIRRICGSDLGFRKLEEIMMLCRENRGKTEISGEIFAEKTPSALYFLRKGRKKTDPVPLNLDGSTDLGKNGTIYAQRVTPNCKRDPGEEVVDLQAMEGAVIRTREDGDRIQPLGCSGEKLLSDYFTDKKIDRPLRDHIALAARGKRILWVCGMGISEDVKIRPDTRTAVKLICITDEKAEV